MACVITAHVWQKTRKDAKQTVEVGQSTYASNAKCTSAIVVISFLILHFTLKGTSIISDEKILVYFARGSKIMRQRSYLLCFDLAIFIFQLI